MVNITKLENRETTIIIRKECHYSERNYRLENFMKRKFSKFCNVKFVFFLEIVRIYYFNFTLKKLL